MWEVGLRHSSKKEKGYGEDDTIPLIWSNCVGAWNSRKALGYLLLKKELSPSLTKRKSPVIPGNRKYFYSYNMWESKHVGDMTRGNKRICMLWDTGELSNGLAKQGVENISPMGALQTAKLSSERGNLLGVVLCLSSKSVRFPAQRQYRNLVIWHLEVSDRR